MDLSPFKHLESKLVDAGDYLVRDLNGNGILDVYEDPRQPTSARVEDLLSQMTLAEKVGLMFHSMVFVPAGKVDSLLRSGTAGITELIQSRHMSHFNLLATPDVNELAAWHNRVQQVAESTRLGIPVTISSDPRHAASMNPGAGLKQNGFSSWPSQLGLAAAGDVELVRQFGDVLRQEFRAAGIHTLLGPMADVATEPRWGRCAGTFGEDFDAVAKFTEAFVQGCQNGQQIGDDSVSCMVKHFPGCGPQEDGTEPHFAHGANQIYPGGGFDLHVEPFKKAIAAGARQLMLSYGVPVGVTSEDVAMAFNREVVQDLLRDQLGFTGVVCTDWMTVRSEKMLGLLSMKPASDWGVGHLSVAEKYARAIEVGVDQFGGESDPSVVLALVEAGQIDESRIDESVRRILTLKFDLGLFDNPFVEASRASDICASDEFVSLGLKAQFDSAVLLKDNGFRGHVSHEAAIYAEGLDHKVVSQFGRVERNPSRADFAILNIPSPKEIHWSWHLLTFFFAEGSLEFPPKQLKKWLEICDEVPTWINLHIDRPTICPELIEAAAGVTVSFGIEDDVLMRTVLGRANATGKLPMELPSSMASVETSHSDLPGTSNPQFPRGFTLRN